MISLRESRGDTRRASENFYRNFFALAAFISFGAALLSDSPFAFAVTLLFGVLSRTAVKKNWKKPGFSSRLPWLTRFSSEEKKVQVNLSKEPDEEPGYSALRKN